MMPMIHYLIQNIRLFSVKWTNLWMAKITVEHVVVLICSCHSHLPIALKWRVVVLSPLQILYLNLLR
ncbi:hypothetical protein Lalb_Chr20g0117451 [Lupinus albus]|uniref:Uncharacterized protein n=1 Tax=Lupinus albus TaxID=3870 RepID=A0A6A4NQ68_LUPAL|nr:hypothetical protein Lalb_Chr20g0117451 [Lupinus albus]